MIFNFFKKIYPNDDKDSETLEIEFNVELIGCVLAYEVAKADGDIDNEELAKIKAQINEKSLDLNLDPKEVFTRIEVHSNESASFNDFINQINNNFSQEQKLEMVSFMWETAYADNILKVDEERLIRRVANMIRLKDIQVLKLKDQAKNI